METQEGVPGNELGTQAGAPGLRSMNLAPRMGQSPDAEAETRLPSLPGKRGCFLLPRELGVSMASWVPPVQGAVSTPGPQPPSELLTDLHRSPLRGAALTTLVFGLRLR